ncbi:uncharacterized protein LOC121351805 isoform X3 [Pyrgilauda ruficollis]|uniref:uncharacterized protein LOC121351805 isoform X3 n=1 Tax=Pyrgilauda ruficollis TaxID=221976 RepID=UPI001B884FAB|nr:uncharacterized protein LOC121351805 isoform X3 [Pyrgilauda ruficollis]
MALLLLGAVLLAAGAAPAPAVPPAMPAPRELARSVLETHGQELRLLRLLGVARTVQRCSAQVSVFTFLPDVPLSMVECGREPQPGDSAQPRSPGTSAGHSSSSSSSSSSGPPPRPRPPPSASLQGPSRRPLSPAELQT